MKKHSKRRKTPKQKKIKKKTSPKSKLVTKQTKANKPLPNPQIPLITLPLYSYLNESEHWYGLLPELICIQGLWIQDHIQKVNIPTNLKPYILNAVNQHHAALMVAGNNFAYFSLHSLRSIMERIAMGWMIHSSSKVNINKILGMLSSGSLAARKLATQEIMDLAKSKDHIHKSVYDMISQYFAHASKMDGVSMETASSKIEMLSMRVTVMPLILLLDVGTRLVTLISNLLKDQGVNFELPKGGKLEGKFDIDLYVRGCAYLMCEKHSPKKAIHMATLFKNIKEIKGEIGITTIYRGGMEVIRYGDPIDKPNPKEIADYCWYAIGTKHDDKVKVKCVKESEDGEVYNLNWPKNLEYDSTCLGTIARYAQSNIDFFDYITGLLKVIEDNS